MTPLAIKTKEQLLIEKIRVLEELVYLTGPDYKDPDIPGSNYAYRDVQKEKRIEFLREKLKTINL